MAVSPEEKKINARKLLVEKATESGVSFTDETTDDELKNLVKEKNTEEKPVIKKKSIVLKDVNGKDVDPKDYFYSKEKGVDTAPTYFNKVSGYPVEREELLTVFNRIFNPSKGFLFYKQYDKEVYIVIVPLKYASTIGDDKDSLDGDAQRHAISFIGEGSVNNDTLRQKLTKVASTIDMTDK